MADAEVYCKWSNQGEGARGAGGWGLVGSGGAHGGGGGIIALSDHAERHAWKEAWGGETRDNLRARVAATKASFEGEKFQVKFWVDQQICPTCQKWLIIDVIGHLKQLASLHKVQVELYAEVKFAGETNKLKVTRLAVWPVTIGKTASYADLPSVYN